MAEYIERERLVKHYENCIDEVKNTNGIAEDFEICLKALKAQPAAEVAEVKHSEWHCSSVSMKTRNITCRHCRRTETISNGRTNFDFCPNCGARMDGEGG